MGGSSGLIISIIISILERRRMEKKYSLEELSLKADQNIKDLLAFNQDPKWVFSS